MFKNTENPLGAMAGSIGKGIFAGLFATTVMTLAQMAEMKFTKRKSSETPALAGMKLLGVEATSEEAKNRLNYFVHFFYGSIWGSFFGILSFLGLGRIFSGIAHFCTMWITGMILLPSLKVSTPPWKWGLKGIISDGSFHAVYAISAALGYIWLDHRKK